MKKLLFENKPCSRCGGSGQYSWCATHGSRCFKCGGDGAELTKRGRAAQDYLNASRAVRFDGLKPGDAYLYEGFSCGAFISPSKWVTVTAVEPKPPAIVTNSGVQTEIARVSVHGLDAKGVECGYEANADTLVRLRRTKEEDRALIDAALLYQSTLAKTGKPTKRKA